MVSQKRCAGSWKVQNRKNVIFLAPWHCSFWSRPFLSQVVVKAETSEHSLLVRELREALEAVRFGLRRGSDGFGATSARRRRDVAGHPDPHRQSGETDSHCGSGVAELSSGRCIDLPCRITFS